MNEEPNTHTNQHKAKKLLLYIDHVLTTQGVQGYIPLKYLRSLLIPNLLKKMIKQRF